MAPVMSSNLIDRILIQIIFLSFSQIESNNWQSFDHREVLFKDSQLFQVPSSKFNSFPRLNRSLFFKFLLKLVECVFVLVSFFFGLFIYLPLALLPFFLCLFSCSFVKICKHNNRFSINLQLLMVMVMIICIIRYCVFMCLNVIRLE